MRIFISTGEVSGDLQGGMLVEALYRQAKILAIDLEIVALGGDRMLEAGANLLANTIGIGSVGLIESIQFLLPTWKIQQKAKKYLQNNAIDIVVLIDYLGPNLAIGNFIKDKLPNVPIIWYIAPQYWVWSPFKKDIDTLIKIPDKILAIFPEEAKFFQERGISSTYVGHPLSDRIKKAPTRDKAREILNINPDQKIITLFPASRKQEIKYLLPVICEAAKQIQSKIENVHFLIPVSLPTYRHAIEQKVNEYNLSATLLEDNTLNAIASADLAITKSGTVNLELALLEVPQVVIYKVNPFTMWVARKILNFSIPFMSPTNLVSMSEIVPELLQEKATVENIVNESLKLLFDNEARKKMQLQYQEIKTILANEETNISDRTAKEIISYAQ